MKMGLKTVKSDKDTFHGTYRICLSQLTHIGVRVIVEVSLNGQYIFQEKDKSAWP